jgi:hypothetical protein
VTTTAAPASSQPSTAELLTAVRQAAYDNPGWYFKEILNCDPYDKQVEIIESVRDCPQTSINGANGTGKDWTVGRIILWWMTLHSVPCPKCCPGYPNKPDNWSPLCKVILAAPTARQVNEIVWRETRYAYYASKVPLGGRMLPEAAKWVIDDQCFALGFSTDRAWNITGFHSPHLLVIVSEAHNFPEDAFVALTRLQPERMVLSFNPFSQTGEAYASHHEKRHLYNPITITAYDSPNVVYKDANRVPGLVTQEDIETYAADWGVESAYFRATVNAEFAESEDNLIPLAWLQAAAGEIPPETNVDSAELIAGIDVAGPGEDETVLTIRSGPAIIAQHHWRIDDPRSEVAAILLDYGGSLANATRRFKSLNIDSAGIGYYFAKHFTDLGYNVNYINVGEGAYDTEHFANLKAELYWGLRMRFKASDVYGLNDSLAVSQLAGIRYGHNSRGQVQIESKVDAKKRSASSPDRAESIMLCYAGDAAGSTLSLIQTFRSLQTGVPISPSGTKREMSEGLARSHREDNERVSHTIGGMDSWNKQW